MIEIKKDKWEESYDRGENFIYYPKEENVLNNNKHGRYYLVLEKEIFWIF